MHTYISMAIADECIRVFVTPIIINYIFPFSRSIDVSKNI